jgi:hypothetical protein
MAAKSVRSMVGALYRLYRWKIDERNPMKMNWLVLGLGVVLTLFGVLFTLQGLDVLPGSPMSGVTLWAILGPIVAIVGLALVGVGFARRRPVLR